MFMRFFGAGIGHKATYKYTGAFRKDVLAMASVTQSNDVADTFVNHLGIPREEDLLAEEQDYGYDIGSGSEDEEGFDDCEGDAADLGAEDGEEPWDVDDLGYDEL
jgi:hypothetical protein